MQIGKKLDCERIINRRPRQHSTQVIERFPCFKPLQKGTEWCLAYVFQARTILNELAFSSGPVHFPAERTHMYYTHALHTHSLTRLLGH